MRVSVVWESEGSIEYAINEALMTGEELGRKAVDVKLFHDQRIPREQDYVGMVIWK